MNERKILLIGCSWTAGTDPEEVTNCYRPAPAEYLDTNLYKIYNAEWQVVQYIYIIFYLKDY